MLYVRLTVRATSVFSVLRPWERLEPAWSNISHIGGKRPYHDQRPTTYYSVFGKVRFWRHSFTAPGQQGLCPLDAELSLPTRGYSDLLQEWAVYGTTDESYRESQTVLERILGLSLSAQAIETSVADAVGGSEPSMSSRPSLLRQRQSRRSWWCRPMAKGCPWCRRLPQRPRCA
jgi:hypothetical protein